MDQRSCGSASSANYPATHLAGQEQLPLKMNKNTRNIEVVLRATTTPTCAQNLSKSKESDQQDERQNEHSGQGPMSDHSQKFKLSKQCRWVSRSSP
mmetsp:Transcript_22708/g.69401  ORF Transcript_22708/g.69401 Transcript_22708/m.69401 type:complete len:96 (+) Transcript_22708:81-368(+)